MANVYYTHPSNRLGILRAVLSTEEGRCLLDNHPAQYFGGFEETKRKPTRPTIPSESVRLVTVSDWILDDIWMPTAMACYKFPMDYNSPATVAPPV